MRFPDRLIRGILIRRYKRFLADIRLTDGRVVTAHCTNTGSMTGCAEPGSTVYISPSTKEGRRRQNRNDLGWHQHAASEPAGS
jgi:sugar fermentation stimulation protein A